ncbi:membrane-associated protein [Gammaproteobacteria bacterium]
MSESLTNYLLSLMGQLDYLAIFLLMAAESSILPVPSELVMVPAGYLAAIGHLDFWLALLAGNLGSIAGSVGSYYLALWLGRPLLLRFGRYFLIDERHLNQAERFVRNHGEISIFSGRFVPGIRHLISLPAGLTRMPLDRFMLYTFLGAGMWNAVLQVLGYLIGDHQDWMKANWSWVVGGALIFAATTVAVYVYLHRHRTYGKVDNAKLKSKENQE